MTSPEIASQRTRLCPRDGFAWELDRETLQASVEAGWPAVELLRCRNGHSLRIWPEAEPGRALALLHPCGVCGLPLPRVGRYRGSGSRRYHEGACARTAIAARRRFERTSPGAVWLPEAQPWWRGYLTPLSPAAQPLFSLDPLAGRMPREWFDGWARVHGFEAAGEAA